MKHSFFYLAVLLSAVLCLSSCGKTYTCQCVADANSDPNTTGQVKAFSKQKAKKLCASSCPNGLSSVK